MALSGSLGLGHAKGQPRVSVAPSPQYSRKTVVGNSRTIVCITTVGEPRLQSDLVHLVERARQGDRHALELLMAGEERRLYACALAVLGDSWDARDALQEAWLEVLAKIGSLRDITRFRPWVARILLNKCNDLLRRRSREARIIAFHSAWLEQRDSAAPEDDEELLTAVQALEADRRLAVALRFFGGLTYIEIAEVTICPLGTVKSRINRGLEDLRRTLADSQGEYRREL